MGRLTEDEIRDRAAALSDARKREADEKEMQARYDEAYRRAKSATDDEINRAFARRKARAALSEEGRKDG